MQDMAPYVPMLMPELQSALVDPLPEVRATAAKALGSLLKGMGEQHFQGLMPWLLATLKSEVSSCHASVERHEIFLHFDPAADICQHRRVNTVRLLARRNWSCALLTLHITLLQKSSVERSGAAQGLAEVLAVLGRDHVEALLPDVLAACTSPSPYVREGNLTLFRFLPHAIPDQFQVLRQTFSRPGGNLSIIASHVENHSIDAGKSVRCHRLAVYYLSYRCGKQLLGLILSNFVGASQ